MRRALFLIALGLAWHMPGLAAPAVLRTNLTADAIVERLLERARSEPSRMAGDRLEFIRRTLIEEFDRRGHLSERVSKDHRVVLEGQRQTTHLLRINGRDLTPAEAAAERSREEANRQRYARRGDRVRAGNREFVDEKLIRRFRYELEGWEEVDGRPAYVLRFRPVTEADDGSIADRILARLGGRVWIDAEDFEAARIEARMRRPLEILGSLVARVDQLGFQLARLRLPDGTWVNTFLGSHATGRKLVLPFDVRMTIREEGFSRTSAP